MAATSTDTVGGLNELDIDLSDNDNQLIDALVDVLGVNRYAVNEEIQTYTLPRFRRAMTSLLDEYGNRTTSIIDVGLRAKQLQSSARIQPERMDVELKNRVNEKAFQIYSEAVRSFEVGNTAIAVELVYRLLEFHQSVGALADAINVVDRDAFHDKIKYDFVRNPISGEGANSVNALDLARYVAQEYITTHQTYSSDLNSDLVMWGNLTGNRASDVEAMRKELCLDEVRSRLQDNIDKAPEGTWNVTRADQHAATTASSMAAVLSKYQLATQDYTSIATEIYTFKLKTLTKGGRIPTPAERSDLLKTRAALGLRQAQINHLNERYGKAPFIQAVREGLGVTGLMTDYVKRELETLRRWLFIKPDTALRYTFDGMREYLGANFVPALEYELAKATLSRKDLDRRYKRDTGEDPFVLSSGGAGTLGFESEGNFMDEATNFVAFFEDNNLIEEIPIEGERWPDYRLAFDCSGLAKPETLSEFFEQYIIRAFTEEPGPKRDRHLQVAPKLGAIVGFTGPVLRAKSAEIGGKILRRFLDDVFKGKFALEASDMGAVNQLKDDFRMSDDDVQRYILEVKIARLKAEQETSVGQGVTGAAVRRLRECAIGLGLDLVDTLEIDDSDRTRYFNAEVSDILEPTADGTLDESCREYLTDVQEQLGLDNEEASRLVEQAVKDKVLWSWREAGTSIKSDRRKDAMAALDKFFTWAPLLVEEEITPLINETGAAIGDYAERFQLLSSYALKPFTPAEADERQRKLTTLARYLSIPQETLKRFTSVNGSPAPSPPPSLRRPPAPSPAPSEDPSHLSPSSPTHASAELESSQQQQQQPNGTQAQASPAPVGVNT